LGVAVEVFEVGASGANKSPLLVRRLPFPALPVMAAADKLLETSVGMGADVAVPFVAIIYLSYQEIVMDSLCNERDYYRQHQTELDYAFRLNKAASSSSVREDRSLVKVWRE
jgi:hypothetical protein